jgi:hypothetical protein
MKVRPSLVLVVLLTSGHLEATSIARLTSSADAIVIGTETAQVQAGKAVTFYLNIERVFTGPIPVGATVNVTWPGNKGNTGVGPGVYRGIWFLKKSDDGGWDCLPAGANGNATFFPDLSLPVAQAPLPTELAYDPDSTALVDQIILETAAGTPRANHRMFLEVVPQPFSAAALRAFRYLSSSATADQMLLGIAGLVEAGDIGGLLSAEKLSDTLTAEPPGAEIVSSAIQTEFRNPDPVAIAILGRMATAAGAAAPIRNAAAQALEAIHSQEALPWLGLLLKDSSPRMQMHGARGFSFFANGVGIPTVQTMRTLDHLNKRQPSSYRTAETEQNIGSRPG